VTFGVDEIFLLLAILSRLYCGLKLVLLSFIFEECVLKLTYFFILNFKNAKNLKLNIQKIFLGLKFKI
jgi:hypothetical protein